MFDLFKGVCMILIVFGHTVASMDRTALQNPLTIGVMAITYAPSVLFMPAFFIMSGFGFRKRTVKSCLSFLWKTLWKFYLCTMAWITILRFGIRAVITSSLEAAFYETLPVLGGYLLGLPDYAEFGKTFFLGTAPMWYVLALALAWFNLNLIMLKVPQKYWPPVVLAVVVSGWWIGTQMVDFFCIPQGMIATGYLYLGYVLKKKKYFFHSWESKEKYWAAAGVCLYLAVIIFKGIDEMSPGIWQLGPVSILLDGYIAVIFLYGFLKLNRFTGTFSNCIRWIGRNSLYVVALHAIEIPCVPWYLITDRFSDNLDVACWSILIIRLLLIITTMVCIQAVQKHSRRSSGSSENVTF